METKTRLEQLLQAKKTHPNMATTGIDVTILKKINDEANKKVKDYKDLNRTITTSLKEINTLINNDDSESKKRVEDLQKSIEEKNSEVKLYKEKLISGDLSKEVISTIRDVEVSVSDNAIKENLQLQGYVGKDVNMVTKEGAYNYVQKLLINKFKNDEIRNNFFKKNINYFDTLKKSNEEAQEARSNV
jgi:hypothetical protein